MPPLYPVDGHPLLEEDALALDADQLREWTFVAERVLGLRGASAPDPGGDPEVTAELKRAVALQVSLLAAKDPEAYFMERVGRGSEDMIYREGYLLHPLAETIVMEVASELEESVEEASGSFPIVGSRRMPAGPTGSALAEHYTAERNANRGLG